MTEPDRAHTNELLHNSQQVVSTHWRGGWRYTCQRFVCVLILTGLCGMVLTGCQDFWDTTAELLRIDGGDDDAEAQEMTTMRVKTYGISTEGFEILLDNDTDETPSLDAASDSATRLTMQSEGLLVRGTGDRNIVLEVGDVIILRLDGSAGSVTLIRAQ